MLKAFELIRPGDLTEAVAAVADGAIPIAGGTDLLVRMKKGMIAPKKIVDLSGLKELREIKEDEENIILGSLVTHGDVVNSELTNKYLSLLVQGCRTVGSPQIRNTGTLGGNIINASPAADSVPPLVALGAKVVLSSVNGEREMKIEEFLVGPGKTLKRPDELLTGIVVKKMKPEERCLYRKLGQRKALAISIASVAVKFGFDPVTKRCTNPAIAFGAVGPVVKRVVELERLLEQRILDQQTIKEISLKAREFCDPISDIRASAEYRREMCCSLLYEALYELTC